MCGSVLWKQQLVFLAGSLYPSPHLLSYSCVTETEQYAVPKCLPTRAIALNIQEKFQEGCHSRISQSLVRNVCGNEESRHTPYFQEIDDEPDKQKIFVLVSETWCNCTEVFVLVSHFLKVKRHRKNTGNAILS